jgi:hypothetical protein
MYAVITSVSDQRQVFWILGVLERSPAPGRPVAHLRESCPSLGRILCGMSHRSSPTRSSFGPDVVAHPEPSGDFLLDFCERARFSGAIAVPSSFSVSVVIVSTGSATALPEKSRFRRMGLAVSPVVRPLWQIFRSYKRGDRSLLAVFGHRVVPRKWLTMRKTVQRIGRGDRGLKRPLNVGNRCRQCTA